jgi:hypothetical protein
MAYKDGIINNDKYNKTNPKILWILKEVNHDGDLENWDMTKILQDIKDEYGIEKGFEKTFAPIVHLSYGIIHRKSWTEVPNHYDKPEIIDILSQIAFINVKKTSGSSTIDNQTLENAYNQNKNLLFQQINEISPNIIIYGGTYHLFENELEMINDKNIKHISAYHPAQRTITQEEYFERVYNEIYK